MIQLQKRHVQYLNRLWRHRKNGASFRKYGRDVINSKSIKKNNFCPPLLSCQIRWPNNPSKIGLIRFDLSSSRSSDRSFLICLASKACAEVFPGASAYMAVF